MAHILTVAEDGQVVGVLPKTSSAGTVDAGGLVALNTQGVIDPSMVGGVVDGDSMSVLMSINTMLSIIIGKEEE